MMRKLLCILVVIFGFSSLSHAQRFSTGGGITLLSPGGAPLEFGLGFNFSALNLLSLGRINFDARATADIDFGSGGAIGVSGLARINFNVLDLYLGPTLNLSFTRGAGIGATFGIRSPVDAPFGVFGEVEFLFVPASLRLRGGVVIPLG
jgi:hypothetical protein